MTKRKTYSIEPRSPVDGSAERPEKPSPSDGIHRHLPSPAAIREAIESLAIVFVWVFLFTTFEAEAFVIPTGSMAPTLMGRHKDLVCPKCGYAYQAGASEEVDRNEAPLGRDWEITSCTCPMCRYTADVDTNNPQHLNYPSYHGDRIEVAKFAYELGEPQRWDVVVFKFPGDATTNYIKRLIGLPGETIRIDHGQIWVRQGQQPFRIARKSPAKLRAMLQPVFDNDYMPKIAESGWPARWYADADSSAPGAWSSEDGAAFHTDGTAAGETWLRYHHLTPSYEQWQEAEAGRASLVPLKPRLITDFTAYDTNRSRRDHASPGPRPGMLGLHWVGDLALECTVEPEGNAGQLVLELLKGGRQFQCRIDVANGRATLSVSGPDMEQFRPTAATNVCGTGRHDVVFSNCDNQLLLWVDGGLVSFDGPTTYEELGNNRPDVKDLAPAGVASAGVPVRISHLRIRRDIYYIAASDHWQGQPMSDYEDPLLLSGDITDQLLWNHPRQRSVDFPLAADQFFMLGDNSANSEDGRFWGREYWVSRELLVGKALFIYWPHSWHQTPYLNIPFPFFPNFSRMGLVR
jgi:signal peptidase I